MALTGSFSSAGAITPSCSSCLGLKQIDCKKCDGDFNSDCPRCKGKGKVNCWKCNAETFSKRDGSK